jgi:hypothetical protein
MYANSFAAAVETSDLRSGLFQFRNAGVPCWNKCLVVHGANHSRSSGDRGHQYLIGIESRIIDIPGAPPITPIPDSESRSESTLAGRCSYASPTDKSSCSLAPASDTGRNRIATESQSS